jgi:hypothetical protein
MPVAVQSQVIRARGYARVRGGVTNSLVAGTVRVLQGDNPADLAAFAATFSAPTVVDAVSGFNVLDFDVAVVREFIQLRFIGDANFEPGVGDVFEFGSSLVPVE